jgi:hypothetical protein
VVDPQTRSPSSAPGVEFRGNTVAEQAGDELVQVTVHHHAAALAAHGLVDAAVVVGVREDRRGDRGGIGLVDGGQEPFAQFVEVGKEQRVLVAIVRIERRAAHVGPIEDGLAP